MQTCQIWETARRPPGSAAPAPARRASGESSEIKSRLIFQTR